MKEEDIGSFIGPPAGSLKVLRAYQHIDNTITDLLYVIGISDLLKEEGCYRFSYELYILHRESPLVIRIPDLTTDDHEKIINHAERHHLHFVNHFLKFKEQQS